MHFAPMICAPYIVIDAHFFYIIAVFDNKVNEGALLTASFLLSENF